RPRPGRGRGAYRRGTVPVELGREGRRGYAGRWAGAWRRVFPVSFAGTVDGSSKIEIVEDRSATTPSDRGFLKVRRLRLRRRTPGAEVFAYDVVDRDALDAVVVALWSPRDGAP